MSDPASSNLQGMDALPFIKARSRRQAMDWSLVLMSQGVEPWIEHRPEGWGLVVQSEDYEKSLDAIQTYRKENRSWHWQQAAPWFDTFFHWGVLFWAAVLIAVHYVVGSSGDPFKSLAAMDDRAVHAGQWWRLFSAILLHADSGHLASNLAIGTLLVGLCMGRYGAGAGLLFPYLAGVCGNLLRFLFRDGHYYGLGASGMVMGALGFLVPLAAPSFRTLLRSVHQRKFLLKSTLAGVFLFLMLGVEPHSDVLAHTGGFLGGLVFGTVLSFVPVKWWSSKVMNSICLGILIVTVLLTWFLCFSSSPIHR